MSRGKGVGEKVTVALTLALLGGVIIASYRSQDAIESRAVLVQNALDKADADPADWRAAESGTLETPRAGSIGEFFPINLKPRLKHLGPMPEWDMPMPMLEWSTEKREERI